MALRLLWTPQVEIGLKIIWNPPNIFFILWLLTYLPVSERCKGWTWNFAPTLFWGGLIFGGLIFRGKFVLVSRGAYIGGRIFWGFYSMQNMGLKKKRDWNMEFWVNFWQKYWTIVPFNILEKVCFQIWVRCNNYYHVIVSNSMTCSLKLIQIWNYVWMISWFLQCFHVSKDDMFWNQKFQDLMTNL